MWASATTRSDSSNRCCGNCTNPTRSSSSTWTTPCASTTGRKGNPASFKKLSALLAQQNFRLAFWRVGVEEVNYRRFFAVNELISLRIEDREVFDRVHHLPLRLVAANVFTGLRVDHIDGLYHPQQYLNRLREGAPDAFLVVEKILAPGEPLKPVWPVQGTTGYDFLGMVNGLFVMNGNADKLDSLYKAFTGVQAACGAIANEDKRLLIEKDLYGGLENLVYQLKTIATRFTHASDFTLSGFRQALEEAFVHFPVYRTYINEEGADERDRQVIAWTMEKARASLPSHVHEIDFIERMLLAQSNPAYQQGGEEERAGVRHALTTIHLARSWPRASKTPSCTCTTGLSRLTTWASIPIIFGYTAGGIPRLQPQRLSAWPHTMNATATHDTKRGEDCAPASTCFPSCRRNGRRR